MKNEMKKYFLNGELYWEIYMEQPIGFEDKIHHDYVFKLRKALYGFESSAKVGMERLPNFLLKVAMQ